MEELRQEYKRLLKVERPQIVEVVSWAAGNGDRSENGDYIYGKKRLREIDKRLHYLQRQMESAEVVDPSSLSGETVRFGAHVCIAYSDGREEVYQIVGESEIDPEMRKISWKSPIAKSLLGKNLGDEVKVRLPKGEEIIEIVDLEYK